MVTYAHKVLKINLAHGDVVEFKFERTSDGYRIVYEVPIEIHQRGPEAGSVSLVEQVQAQEKRKTTIIMTSKLPSPPPWTFGRMRTDLIPNNK
jgi:hypothetical protein